MSQIIIESKGTVDKYVFEGIVVFWNAPYSIKEHSAVGCDAALKCQRRLVDLQSGKSSRQLDIRLVPCGHHLSSHHHLSN
jgi:adenylate cyclase